MAPGRTRDSGHDGRGPRAERDDFGLDPAAKESSKKVFPRLSDQYWPRYGHLNILDDFTILSANGGRRRSVDAGFSGRTMDAGDAINAALTPDPSPS